jgi:hypothetical protein
MFMVFSGKQKRRGHVSRVMLPGKAQTASLDLVHRLSSRASIVPFHAVPGLT